MKDKTLLILAAGMGSRFGGLKQMEPVGPNGEFIIDYSIFDAIRSGFNKIVFIIKEENYDVFKDTIGKRIENFVNKNNIKVEYAFQNNNNIPNKYEIPSERVKPFGTAHAILCAKDYINEPFVIINSDDFYGVDAFKQASLYIDNEKNDNLGLVGYKVVNTLTENGSVKRGICYSEDNKLVKIVESSIIENNGVIESTPLDSDEMVVIDRDATVSMNMLVFYPDFFGYIEKNMDEFLSNANLLKDEYLIPDVMTKAIHEGFKEVNMIDTDAKWVGVTYKEDKPCVVSYIQELVDKELYPNNLWE